MFTVFQFFNLIPTTELIGPFILPHAVCAVIVTIFVSAIFATDNTNRNIEDTIKSDHHLDNVVDPPTNSGPRTLTSTHRSSANSHALQRTPTNLIPHRSNNHSPRSTRSRPLFPSTIQEFKVLHAVVQFFSCSKIPGPQLLLPAPVKTRTLLPTAKLKAPNSYWSLLQHSWLPTLTTTFPTFRFPLTQDLIHHSTTRPLRLPILSRSFFRSSSEPNPFIHLKLSSVRSSGFIPPYLSIWPFLRNSSIQFANL